MQELFPPQSPENREREICLCHYRKSVLDKREKIEMLDYKERKQLFENYYRHLNNTHK